MCHLNLFIYLFSQGLFTRREGNPCVRVTLASGFKVNSGLHENFSGRVTPPLRSLYQLYCRGWSCMTLFVTSSEVLYGKHVKFMKKWENIIIVYGKYLILFRCL